jgi:hypothetical protein
MKLRLKILVYSTDEEEPIFHVCEAHRYDKMSVGEATHFRGMKQLLAHVAPGTDANVIPELKQRTHSLCARFLGGAWKIVPLEELKLIRIKWVLKAKNFQPHLKFLNG